MRTSLSHCVRRAYTLIELLMVVAVLGLAGALLVPQLGQPDELTIQGAVRQLISDISFAQSDALSHQDRRRVYFFDDGRGYVLLRSPYDVDTDYIFDPLGRPGASGAYVIDFSADDRFEGLTIESVELDGDERFLTFDELGGTIAPDGTPGTGGFIILKSQTQQYRINIAAFTGKMSVEKQ